MKLELQEKTQPDETAVFSTPDGEPALLVTPPIKPEYWLFRVAVSETQAIVAFPKFTTSGIGFQIEAEDWNTNLPYTQTAETIYHHIACNKGDNRISRATCLQAIRMLQAACADYAAKQKAKP